MNRPTYALPLSTRPSGPRSTATQSNRRLDIQGLRAVAVIAVVIYHADVPLSGGFVGVDMFFVISGYVITLMLVRELEKSGTINFRQFFVRRFLRLTPALSLVVVATLVGSFFLQSPLGEQKSTAATGAGALLMVANFVIFRATGGYFEPAADSNPLLHTWSLAVEEQFYLVFPVLLYVAWRWGRRSLLGRISVFVVLTAVVTITLFLTLSGAVMGGLPLHPFLTSYYSPLLRTWEFGAGVAIAFIPVLTAERQRFYGAIFSAFGIILIGVSFIFISESDAFPGFVTLIPVLGTAFLIYGGTHPGNAINAVLTTKPWQFVGDISYSWYLWHWPLIVFSTALFPEYSWITLFAGLVSIFPAMASFYLIESPMRRMPIPSFPSLLRLGSVTALPVFVFSSVLFVGSNMGWGIDRVRAVQALHPGWTHCMSFATMPNGPSVNPTYDDCVWSGSDGGSPVYLVGDSNASQFSGALREATKEVGGDLSMRTAGGCPFIDIYRQVGPEFDGPDQLCRAYFESTLSWLVSQPAGTVVMASTEGYWFEPGMQIGASQTTTTSDEASRSDFLTDGLIRAIKPLEDVGHNVVVVQALPHPTFAGYKGVPKGCSTFAIAFAKCDQTVPLADIERVQSASRSSIVTAAKTTGATPFDLRSFFCDIDSCHMNKNGELLYQDSLHITVDTSMLLSRQFANMIRNERDFD